MIKKKENIGTAVAVGVGIAVASAAAYLLFGDKGKKNRKALRGWAIKMRGEIIEKLEKIKEVTEPVYNQVVDTVSARYAKAKDIDKKELEELVADIRKHWKAIIKTEKSKKKK
ncbi:MAG: hypothetical protein WC534_02515 [Candidatus Paceibacterota bacterium]